MFFKRFLAGTSFLATLTVLITHQNFPNLQEVNSTLNYRTSNTRSTESTPCQRAITTSMCKGIGERTKDFPRQLSQTVTLFKSLFLREKYFNKNSIFDTCTDLLVISDSQDSFNLLLQRLHEEGYTENDYKKFRFIYVPALYPKGLEYFDKLFGACASIRLFIDKLLPEYDALLYVDSDVIILQNIDILWKEFESFPSTVWASFGPDAYDLVDRHIPYYPTSGINSGIAYLNLTRMRKTNFFKDIRTIAKMLPRAELPDQDFLNFYFLQNPKEIKYLDCRKNYFYLFCWAERPCLTDAIDILHGAGRTFILPSGEKVFRGIFQIFQRTRLDSNFTRTEFVARLETDFQHQWEIYKYTSNCGKNVPNFKEILFANMKRS